MLHKGLGLYQSNHASLKSNGPPQMTCTCCSLLWQMPIIKFLSFQLSTLVLVTISPIITTTQQPEQPSKHCSSKPLNIQLYRKSKACNNQCNNLEGCQQNKTLYTLLFQSNVHQMCPKTGWKMSGGVFLPSTTLTALYSNEYI